MTEWMALRDCTVATGTRSRRAFAQRSENYITALLPHRSAGKARSDRSDAARLAGGAAGDRVRMRRVCSLLILALVAGSVSAAGLPRWLWPVSAPHPIVRSFLAPVDRYSAGHRGIDIGAANAQLVAPADGTVHFAGTVVDRGVLSIAHPGGLLSSYEPVVTTLKKGDTVRRGDPIGTLQPGHCSSPCLHFGVRLDGEYVSPLLYLGEVPRSVLLPTRRIASGAADLSRAGSSGAAGSPGLAGWSGAAALSGPGMSHGVALLEPLGRDVRVDLGGAEARMAQHLLHGPQIRSPVEQVGSGGVA
jgi:murein DD-endopeptidase MepM/ murein hydrolase activator NlpD